MDIFMLRAINPPLRTRPQIVDKPKRRKATFKKSDVLRAMDAAKTGGLLLGGLEIRPDGTIRVLSPDAAKAANAPDLFEEWEARL